MVGVKFIKKIVVRIVMIALGRAFQAASRFDPYVCREVSRWPEGFSVMMEVLPTGPRMCLSRTETRLKYLGGRPCDADLVIRFKNIESGFLVCGGFIGAETGAVQCRMLVKGDLPLAMSFIRCVNRLEVFLFPKFISRRLLKRVPSLTLREQGARLAVLLAGIPLGL